MLAFSKRSIRHWPTLLVAAIVILGWISPAMAQGGLEGRITFAIDQLVRIINIIIIGFIVWAGLVIAKGEHHGMQKLIYGVIGLVVVNAAHLIINYFS